MKSENDTQIGGHLPKCRTDLVYHIYDKRGYELSSDRLLLPLGKRLKIYTVTADAPVFLPIFAYRELLYRIYAIFRDFLYLVSDFLPAPAVPEHDLNTVRMGVIYYLIDIQGNIIIPEHKLIKAKPCHIVYVIAVAVNRMPPRENASRLIVGHVGIRSLGQRLVKDQVYRTGRCIPRDIIVNKAHRGIEKLLLGVRRENYKSSLLVRRILDDPY